MIFTSFINKIAASALTLATAVVLFTSCNKDEPETNTVTDVVLKNNDFTILRAAVTRAGLADALRGGTITVFAPNDAAFRASGFPDVAAINAVSVSTLAAILQYHVLNTRIPAANIPTATNTPQPTLLSTNGTVYITKTATGVSVNGSRVTTADVPADNGVIHVIDRVLFPPAGDIVQTAIAEPQNFSLLVAAVTRAGAAVASALQSPTAITVFAPTNAAFISAGFSASAINAATPAALTRILTYHVVSGRVFSPLLSNGLTPATLLGATNTVRINLGAGVTVTGTGNGTNASNVIIRDVTATNGVVHVIDRVLLP